MNMHHREVVSNQLEELLRLYAWWACILILQMMTFTWFTGQIRVKNKVIHSEEDRIWMEEPNIILCPSGGGHYDVDRIRSVHFHDLTIIMPFLLITPLWLITQSNDTLARSIIYFFSISKILDSTFSMKIINVSTFISLVIKTVYHSILFYITADLCWFYLFN